MFSRQQAQVITHLPIRPGCNALDGDWFQSALTDAGAV